MGLSGNRVKQRIPDDPRNLTWADDAANFGSNYLAKFGWDASRGLGVDGGGRTSHIKVSHKLDMLGIGAAHQKNPNGIAWKQNMDFENLLKRLNEASTQETAVAKLKAWGVDAEDEKHVDGDDKKRKRKKECVAGGAESAKRKKKKGEDDRQIEVSEGNLQSARKESRVHDATPEPAKPFVPRNRAHRARAIASKAISSKSSTAIAEILGIASNTLSGSSTPFGQLTPVDDGAVTLDKLTTSTKSVADYFKEKLLAKSARLGSDDMLAGDNREDTHDVPRGGLGSSRLQFDTATVTTATTTTIWSPDAESRRTGLPKFSSLISSNFLSSTVPSLPSYDTAPSNTSVTALIAAAEDFEEVRRRKLEEAIFDVDGFGLEKKRKRTNQEKKRWKEEGSALEVGTDAELSKKYMESAEDDAKQVNKKKAKRRDAKARGREAEDTGDAIAKQERRRLRRERKSHKISGS